MSEFSIWLGWLSDGIAWFPIAWFVIALLIGIPWIISDEISIRRTAPKPAEVIAFADKMEAEHGKETMAIVGQAIYEALEHKNFTLRRFLKAVSAELAQR